jgi:hypothetical protein
VTKEEVEALALDIEKALTAAGLTLATDDTPQTPNGWAANGVGVRASEVDGEHVVMLTWGSADSAPFEVVPIMLGAAAEVLALYGFAVERHPVGAAQLVTGRTE